MNMPTLVQKGGHKISKAWMGPGDDWPLQLGAKLKVTKLPKDTFAYKSLDGLLTAKEFRNCCLLTPAFHSNILKGYVLLSLSLLAAETALGSTLH